MIVFVVPFAQARSALRFLCGQKLFSRWRNSLRLASHFSV
jgi:hypothetical protein